MSNFSDKCGQCKGAVRDGVLQVWLKDCPKREFCATVTLAEIDRTLGIYGNSNYALYSIAERIINDATDRWIEGTKDEKLREMRRKWDAESLDLGRMSSAHTRQIESAARVIAGLYEAETGSTPMSWYERAVASR